MDADEILKRDAELRVVATAAVPLDDAEYHWKRGKGWEARVYLASIAAAERALIEAVGALNHADIMFSGSYDAALRDVRTAYRALIAAMESAQR